MLKYKINNEDIFERYGMLVSADDGLTDRLGIKGVEEIDLPGHHGKDVDLSEICFDTRTITLRVGFLANSPDELEEKIARFRRLLLQKELLRLEVSGHGLSLHYDVYCQTGFKVTKKWRDGKTINTFILTLIEPQPVKHIYRCRTQQAILETISPNAIQIGFGDGCVERYCFNKTIEHNYADGYILHHVIVAGVLDKAIINTNMELICSVSS
jgi:hypothetical protein